MSARWFAAVVVLGLLSRVDAALAGPSVAYVDEVAVFGGVDESRVRALVVATAARRGLSAQFAAPAKLPCGDDSRCLLERAQAIGARVGLRFTMVEVADGLVAAALIVDVDRHDTRRELLEGIDLVQPDPRLVAALPEGANTRRPRRLAAWSLAVGAGALAIGGAAAVWHSRELRDDFFSKHIAENGDVIGISPRDARASEQRAQRWSLAGGVLLVGAAAAGLGATMLFVTERGGGIAIGGTL